MPTLRLTLEYEGTRYRGWQEQKNARSVAGELRRAVEEVAGAVGELGGSGRTDAGVHALAQVAHLRLARKVEPERFRREVNDRLPPDIHLLAAAAAPDRFHARHDAVLRSYLYQVSTRRTALAKRFVWWVKRPLDVGAMRAAAAHLAGKHDFRLFCEKPAEQTSTLVVVERAELAADGALVEVGSGTLGVEDFAALVAGRGKAHAEWTAPPSGLFLERVVYPGDPPLGPLAAAVPVR